MRLAVGLLLLLLPPGPVTAADNTTLAFGSCLRQWKPAPILDTVRALGPDAFVFAGDNVYTDTGRYRRKKEPERIALAYEELAGKPAFQALRASTRLLATWDDHDYGRDNAGAEYPWKNESKAAFVSFFSVPDSSPVHRRAGVYSAHWLGDAEHPVQILLLDTRTFRSPLHRAEADAQCTRIHLTPTSDTTATVLGDQQWQWLADQLKQPAALRLIVSSIQVIPDRHCFEKWSNFPHERERLIQLIRASGGVPTVLLSGDRHFGEISALPGPDNTLPLYEITASGLNSAGAGRGEVNPYRVSEDNVRVDHFGVIRYRHKAPASVELALYDAKGRVVQNHLIDYASWQAKP
jgi:alkaline phosphatase D